MVGSQLLGIALVVDDVRKGCKLGFRYPVALRKTPVPLKNSGEEMDYDVESSQLFHDLEAALFAKLFRPKPALCNQVFHLVIGRLQFISFPILVSQHHTEAESPKNNQTTSSSSPLHGSSQKHLTMFNVVFALNPKTSSTQMCSAYGEISKKLAQSLLHEENRIGFMSSQVRLLLNLDEALMVPPSNTNNNNTSSSTSSTGPGSSSNNKTQNSSSSTSSNSHGSTTYRQTLIDMALEKSSLANLLKEMYHQLNESGKAQVEINNWIQLSLISQLNPTTTENVKCLVDSMRPYQTLLLSSTETAALESALPADASAQLVRLLNAANPLLSFRDIHLELGISLKRLYFLSAHLVQYGVGRVITTVTKHGIYQVLPSADIQPHSPVALGFHQKFAPHSVHEVLAKFSSARCLGEYLKKLPIGNGGSTASSKPFLDQSTFVKIVVWLLQHNLIFQLHRYVHLLPAAGGSIENRVTRSPMKSSVIAAHPPLYQSPTTDVVDSSSVLSSSRGGFSGARLFKRLSQYFDGRHHFEEIMYRENISRSELRAVLSSYSDIAVCCLHE